MLERFGVRIFMFSFGFMQATFMASMFPNFATNPVVSYATKTCGEWAQPILISVCIVLIVFNLGLSVGSMFMKFTNK